MTDLIARLTALEKEATPGEWKASGPYASESGSDYCEPCDMHEEHSPKDCPGNIVGPVLVDVGDYGTFNQPDTHFIVELRNNFDAILHALKVQQAAEAYVSENPPLFLQLDSEMYYECCHCQSTARSENDVRHRDECPWVALVAAVKGEQG